MRALSVDEKRGLFEVQLDLLRQELQGCCLTNVDVDYDTRRQVWNGLHDRRPRVIVVCEAVSDVVSGVKFARRLGLPVSVRGGGHSLAGHGACDDGVMIDLSLMRAVTVDPLAQTAKVEGGATAGDVIRETQVHGLAVPTGNAAPVGIGGLTLGGGVGYLRRKYGLTCDSLLSVDMVLADGSVVRASRDENPDLFWAVRGGGGNFGIAVGFSYRLQRVGPEVFGIHLVFDAKDVTPVTHGCMAFLQTATRDISINMECITMPPEPMAPPHLAGRNIVMMTGIHAGGDFKKAERDIAPLRRLATPILDLCGPTDYAALHHMLDPMIRNGRPAYAQSLYVAQYSEAVADVVETAVRQAGPFAMTMVWGLGGAVADVPADATAFGDRGAACIVMFDATVDRVSDLPPYIDWIKASCDALRPHAYNGGTYLNLAGLEEDISAVRSSTYGKNDAKLLALKKLYDPENVFRFNVNIQ